MGLLNNLRGFFSGSKKTQAVQVENEYEKTKLAEKIVDLVAKIQRINCFDSSVRNLSNVSIYELKRKSLDELNSLCSSLENKLSELNRQHQRIASSSASNREALETSKWTGKKPANMSDLDCDRLQRSDDYR